MQLLTRLSEQLHSTLPEPKHMPYQAYTQKSCSNVTEWRLHWYFAKQNMDSHAAALHIALSVLLVTAADV